MQVSGSASTLGSVWSSPTGEAPSKSAPAPSGSAPIDFSNMSIGQMDSERKDLATSGKITMTQNLTLYAMEGFTQDGRSLAQTADASQSYNWYAKLNLGIDDAKKMGGPTEKETVAAYQGLINAFKSVEV